MRVGIDARSLCGSPTGVGRYLSGLLREWSQIDGTRRHEFVLYAPDALAIALDSRRFATRRVPGSAGLLWEQIRLPRATPADHLDVFFAPAYTAPLALAIPTVVAIHDVSFAAHPEWFRPLEGLRLRSLSRAAARRARAIVTISEFSRREIIERLGVDAARVHVIPPGVDPPVAPRRGTAPMPRVLFVGSTFTRRRVADLVRAFAPIARAYAHAALDIVGDNRSYPREDLERIIEAQDLGGRARWHRYAAETELQAFYGEARAFAFLSEYEGLGLTPLEALAAGIPVVLLDTPVARESCGDAALYVPGGDIASTTRALEQVLFDEPTRARLLAAAPAVLARYSWQRAGKETLALLEDAGRVARSAPRP